VSLKSITGYVDPELGNSTEEASHALVYIIKGLQVPYKQVVAWYLTGAGTSGAKLWTLTKRIIQELYERSILVRAVTSDMGGSNVGMWKAAGLNVNDGQQCSIAHPCNDQLQLYFVADVPHLLKNARSCLEKHDITVPTQVTESHGLPSNTASMSHIEAVVALQQNSELRVAPRLSSQVRHPGQYGKMKVSCATKVFSHSTSSALRSLADSGEIDKNAFTTAWLCECLNQWFDMMSNRKYKCALFENSTHVNKLQTMISVVQQLRVVGSKGNSTTLKPWQKAIILSTNAALSLHNDLVVKGDYMFLLTCD